VHQRYYPSSGEPSSAENLTLFGLEMKRRVKELADSSDRIHAVQRLCLMIAIDSGGKIAMPPEIVMAVTEAIKI